MGNNKRCMGKQITYYNDPKNTTFLSTDNSKKSKIIRY